jgi:hypothetical protein
MFKIENSEQLKSYFRIFEQEEVQTLVEMNFPLVVKDYLAWNEPSGHRVYLVFQSPTNAQPYGVVFEKTRGGEPVPMMCDWCHSIRPKATVALLTARVTSRQSVGVHACHDLQCKDRLSENPAVHDLRETLRTDQKLHRLLEKMASFTGKLLF